MMLPFALLTALVASVPAPPPPPQTARAQTQALVQIIHQRTVRTDEAGQTQVLLQFE